MPRCTTAPRPWPKPRSWRCAPTASRASRASWCRRTVHPHYRARGRGDRRQPGAALRGAAVLHRGGRDARRLRSPRYEGEDITALVIQQPNFFGRLEDVDALTDWAHAHNVLVIAVVNPTSLALLKPPGQWGARGADIAVGEGQPLGVPLSSGGPYFGFMTTRMEYVRQMPGRIVGRTLDVAGHEGFTLTLQAREQHIRRAKATSNICTNQGLLMTAATIYMSLMGPQGWSASPRPRTRAPRELVAALTRLPGVRPAFSGPVLPRGGAAARPAGGAGARGARGARHPRRARSRRATTPSWARRCWCAPPRPRPKPTSSATAPRCRRRCRPRAPPERLRGSDHVRP